MRDDRVTDFEKGRPVQGRPMTARTVGTGCFPFSLPMPKMIKSPYKSIFMEIGEP